MDNSKSHSVVAAVGETLWDCFEDGKRLGGAPANLAYHVSQWGARGIILTALGQDALGRELAHCLAEAGLDTSFVQWSESAPTGTVDVTTDQQGVPTFTVHPGAWDEMIFSAELESLAPTLDALVFGSLGQRYWKSRDTLDRLLDSLSPNCVRFFDMNLRDPHYTEEIVLRSLERTHWLKCNDDEVRYLANAMGMEGDERLILENVLDRFGLSGVVCTRGRGGACLLTETGLWEQTGETVDVKDTVGAGDSFLATVVVGTLWGWPTEKILKNANHIAAYVCSQRGAMPEGVQTEMRKLEG